MGNHQSAAAAKKRRPPPRHVPHEMVTQILLRLPVRSLLRFKCVCKLWRETISDDPSFRRDLRLRRQDEPCVLIAPQIKTDDPEGMVVTTGLYRLEETQAAATLEQPLDAVPEEVPHGFAHCDGLVLMCSESAVRVLNPMTRRILTLPPGTGTGTGANAQAQCTNHVSHQAFGLGRDPSTGAYKAARFFNDDCNGSYIACANRVELFTIGEDQQQQWRPKPEPSPHNVMVHRTATFFKGSLIWTISRYDPPLCGRGFVRLNLQSESFSVVPPPPCRPWFDGEMSTLSELNGELCVTCSLHYDDRWLDMWMCTNVDGLQLRWDKRYTIHWDWALTSLSPVAMLADGVLICHQASRNRLFRCILRTKNRVKVKNRFRMNDLQYYNLEVEEEATLVEHPQGTMSCFQVIPYVPSLVSI